MIRIFLAVLGTCYVVLAGWCAFWPRRTSAVVGLDLRPGTGQSEYLVIYGGLQLALGLLFLLPLVRRDALPTVLTSCVLIHACLVVFRTISFVAFSGIERTTYLLAAVEWLILTAAVILWWRS